jgi:hypothetical protein
MGLGVQVACADASEGDAKLLPATKRAGNTDEVCGDEVYGVQSMAKVRRRTSLCN